MKLGLSIVVACAACTAHAIPFRNLDFEDSDLTGFQFKEGAPELSVSTEALKGWEVRYNNSLLTRLALNDHQGGFPRASLNSSGILNGLDGPSVQGHYGLSFLPIIKDRGNGVGSFILSQNGQVPFDARSIKFLGYGESFKVFLNDTELSLSSTPSLDPVFINYRAFEFAGDISAFAGSDVTLKFQTYFTGMMPPNGDSGISLHGLDSIRFSPEAIPEPTTLGLLALGAGLMLLKRRKA